MLLWKCKFKFFFSIILNIFCYYLIIYIIIYRDTCCIEHTESTCTKSSVDDDAFATCVVCNNRLIGRDCVPCSKCEVKIHVDCGELNLSNEDQLICSLCARGISITRSQSECFEKQKVAAAKMVTFSEELFPQLQVNECVTLSVPQVDRGPLDLKSIFGVVTDFRNGVYQIGTKNGLIKGWFPRNKLNVAGTRTVSVEDVPKEVLLSLREAASFQSIVGGQGYQKCTCKANKNQCRTKRCSCFQLSVKCNSRCHQSLTCFNK